MDLTCVTVDCRNPVRVATFWNEALGWGGLARVADDGSVICRPPEGALYLEFVRVPEDKMVKNRVHLGCTAGTLDDLDDEIARLLDLGATIAWEEEFAATAHHRNVVLQDPEGNEFCLGATAVPR